MKNLKSAISLKSCFRAFGSFKMVFGVVLIGLIVMFSSCKKYLELKPDKKLRIISSLSDISLLIDHRAFYIQHSVYGQIYSDDYYLTDAGYNSVTAVYRPLYIWGNAEVDPDWTTNYQRVAYANTALDALKEMSNTEVESSEGKRLKGSALFYRACSFFDLAQCYAKCYDENSAATELGIPLRLEADHSIPTVRANLKETYSRIISDLLEAADLLPINPLYKTRPSKAAAYGMLSRTYLAMQDYEKAGLYAAEYLGLSNELLDYNTLSLTSLNPIPALNKEVVFTAISAQNAMVNSSFAIVDSSLYKMYGLKDLRRSIYFRNDVNGLKRFKGTYDNSIGSSDVIFNGIATDEMYLIKAECEARAGRQNEALQALNTLLIKRYETGSFVPVATADTNEALIEILKERRKELVFRNRRWTDLRRLNKEQRFAITIERKVNGTIYKLEPNSSKYIFLIPQQVINMTGIPQNQR